MPDRIDFLGAPVDRLSTEEALRWIETAIAQKTPRLIAVVNANKHYLMARNAELRRIVANADLVVPEWAIVWGAKKLKLPAVPHSGGILIMRDFIPLAAAKGYRPYFLGAKKEVVTALAEKLRADHPQLQLAGFHDGYLTSPEIEREVIDDIRRSKADILFVAMGSPKQELWIDRHLRELNVPVSLGVGGSFDVLAGLKEDTPDWARGRGLEWLYRLMKDPRTYWKRYLVTNSWFVLQVVRARLRGGRHAAA